MIRLLRHESHVLRGNASADPASRDLWLYLPPSYDAQPARRYPVLYCLAPFAGTGEQQVVGTPWSPGLSARMDRFISQGMPEAIVAFPDCFTRFGGSQYMNSSATGRYEDYLCDELVPFLDRELRTTGAGGRGVFGKSSGGYGALRLAMRRPGLFAAFACQSGDMSFAHCYAGDFPKAAATLTRCGGVTAFWERFTSREKKKDSDFAVVSALAMAAAYSPDATQPLGLALPFDVESAELLPAVWARWKACDPIDMLEDGAVQRALAAVKLAFFDCGSRDEYFLHVGLSRFTARLATLGLAHEREEFDDGHRSLSYRYDVSIPKLVAALSHPA